MNPERWREIERIFNSVLDLEPEEQEAFLERACAGDEDLRQYVQNLLASHKEEDDFIERPALEVARDLAADPGSMLGPDLSGSSLGHYRILDRIGSGGMGVVYRANDSALGRDVAIKVLPDVFAADPERMARFEREARLLASLNHPNIASIYGLEQIENQRFLVLELVEGETLAERLRKGPLSMEESLRVCCQIAEGLKAAHEKGIIHRDLKPANVQVTPDGKVKLLDFGLARALRAQAATADVSLSPTITDEMTRPGVVLGTAAFMSPEQIKGMPAEKRADIWAFGCVLYECLTGKRTFRDDTITEVMASILKSEPDWTLLPVETPPSVRAALKHCLEKDRDLRIQDIADVVILLKEKPDPEKLSPDSARAAAPRRRWVLFAASLALITAAAVFLILQRPGSWFGDPSSEWESASYTQLTREPGIERFSSLSPDGMFVVYEARGDIYRLRVGGSKSVNLTGDSPAEDTQPAFSPDGQFIAFRSERDEGGIYYMGATGESVKRLCDFGYNPSWTPDSKEVLIGSENIVTNLARSAKAPAWIVTVATGDKRQLGNHDAVQPVCSPHNLRIAYWTGRNIWTMHKDGSDPVAVTNDTDRDWNPIWSPDGKFLYFVSDRSGSNNIWRVPIDEESGHVMGALEIVTFGGSGSRQNPTLSGDGRRLVYSDMVYSSCIYKVAFDPITEKVTGTPVAITDGSRLDVHPAISPDGSTLAVTSMRPNDDIWVMREDGSNPYPLTSDSYLDRCPRWSPDGKQIVFYSNRSGRSQVWMINADGTGLRQVTDGNEPAEWPTWSPDGLRILYSQSGSMWWADPKKAPKDQVPVRVTESRLAPYSWSSDGRDRLAAVFWPEPGIVIYSVPDGKFEPFTDFGHNPVWMKDNRRLLFRGSSTHLWDPQLWIGDTQSGNCHVISEAPQGSFFSEIIAISPDNCTIYYPLLTATDCNLWMLSQR